MNAKEITSDVKNEITKSMETLLMLRDEAKLQLHLATLEAKQEWSEKLEPDIDKVQRMAQQMTDTSRTTVRELVERVEAFVSRLRGNKTDKTAPSNPSHPTT